MPGSQKARDDWVSKAYGEGSGSQRIGDVWVSRVREVWVSKDERGLGLKGLERLILH